jgi:hypothetical protein
MTRIFVARGPPLAGPIRAGLPAHGQNRDPAAHGRAAAVVLSRQAGGTVWWGTGARAGLGGGN